MTPPVVVITGASSGIGHATALAFARQGASVVLAARGVPGLEAVANACRELGVQAEVVLTDVSDAQAVRALADAAIARFGGFDVWVNNVGVGVVGLFDQTPIEAHHRVIQSNLLGHMNGAHAALRHFRARRRGTLINMISIAGWAAAPYASAYSASKFAVRGFSEAIRAEMSALNDVHVCDVYPTFVDTPGMPHGANHTGRSLKPPPPLLDPREVADVVVSLVHAPRATTSVGSLALPARLAHAIAPNWVARSAKWLIDKSLEAAGPAAVFDGNLYRPSIGNGIDGGFRQRERPAVVAAVGTAALAASALALLWLALRPGRRGA